MCNKVFCCFSVCIYLRYYTQYYKTCLIRKYDWCDNEISISQQGSSPSWWSGPGSRHTKILLARRLVSCPPLWPPPVTWCCESPSAWKCEVNISPQVISSNCGTNLGPGFSLSLSFFMLRWILKLKTARMRKGIKP